VELAQQRRLERRLRTGMQRFSFFIYRFNNPVMKRLFRTPSNRLHIEQGVISMLAGDVFDSPQVLRRLYLFKLVYGALTLRDLRRWRAAHTQRMSQARAHFSGGTMPQDH
jgi:hypothetical protein